MSARRIAGLGTTVFSTWSALAREHAAVNLGQGVPDLETPEVACAAAARAIREGRNQYAPGDGAPALREAIAEHARRFHGMRVDPASMVTITAGATEAVFDAILALVDPGDEVVVFEPAYDAYAAAVRLAGAVLRPVTLRAPDAQHGGFWFAERDLAAAFGPRTRLAIVNTPHNPTGKVFTRDELGIIAEHCQRHGAVALTDEVYEHIVYSPARHVRLATLPGMAERTVTVSSGGKTFHATGWKVGWAIAAPDLTSSLRSVHQYVTFAIPPPFQEGVAAALRLPDAYFADHAAAYRRRRDRLLAALDAAGLAAHAPEGAYFAMVEASSWGHASDDALCRFLVEAVGVAALPASAFHQRPDAPGARRFARFAFCKPDAVLDAAAARLRARSREGER